MAAPTRRAARGGLRAHINVTPLVDVVLVLLIIFIVVTPLLTQQKDVHLPAAITAQVGSAGSNALVVTVTADKRIWLDHRQVDAATLARELGRRLKERPERELSIRADSRVSVGDLRPLLLKLKAAGLVRISFAVLATKSGAP